MFENKYIQIKGIQTRYWQMGAEGTPVLLLHGIGCSVLEWEHNVAALAARHRVFAVDLLGFGLTDKPEHEKYSIHRLAQFSLDFLTALQIPSAHVAGNSLGGIIGLECARIAPERVQSLLLVDPAGMDRRGTLLEFRLATIPYIGELLTRPNPNGTRMLWKKALYNPTPIVTEAFVKTKVALASMQGAQAAFLKTLRSFADVIGFKPEGVKALHAALPHIHTPTFVLWGQDDAFVTVAHAEVLRRLLPNVQVQIWQQCGHAPQIEYPAKFNEAALKFWATPFGK
jgi:pimeloyl-ACP methyl ester carboxylesterase